MTETENSNPVPAISQLVLAILAVLLAFIGIAVAIFIPPAQPDTTPQHTLPPATPYSLQSIAQPTEDESQLFERGAAAFTTLIPTLTPFMTATVAPVTPIPWTAEDFNALTWLCYEEVRGMREKRYDACLSVISTVRQRYAYDNAYFETSIVDTLLRENQFPIDFDIEQPAPDQSLQDAVEQYRWGARGSCTGYLYYDSIPDGPSICVISASNGQFVEFHDGWR